MANPAVKPKALKVLEQAAWAYVRLELLKLKIDPPAMSLTDRYKTMRGFFASRRGKRYVQECQRLHEEFWQRVLEATNGGNPWVTR